MPGPKIKAKDPEIYQLKKNRTVKAPVSERYNSARTTGPDPRDPRVSGVPGMGNHKVAKMHRGSQSGCDAHAIWEACEICHLRLSSRVRSTRASSESGTSPHGCVQAGGNEAPYSDQLKRWARKLQVVQAKKQAWLNTLSTTATAQAIAKSESSEKRVSVTEDSRYPEMGISPGRKMVRRHQLDAEQEYQDRTTIEGGGPDQRDLE